MGGRKARLQEVKVGCAAARWDSSSCRMPQAIENSCKGRDMELIQTIKGRFGKTASYDLFYIRTLLLHRSSYGTSSLFQKVQPRLATEFSVRLGPIHEGQV